MHETESLIQWASLTLCFIVAILFYWHLMNVRNYWTSRGLKSCKAQSILESIFSPPKKNLQEEDLENYKKLGRIHGRFYPTFFAAEPCLVVGEPDVLRNILLKDFGSVSNRRKMPFQDKMRNLSLIHLEYEQWKRVRSIISPAFSTGKVKRLLSIFKDSSKTLTQNFQKATEKGERIEVKRFYGAFTMDVIASSAFSTKLDSYNDPDNPFAQNARKMILKFTKDPVMKFLWHILPFAVFKIIYNMIPSKLEYLKKLSLDIIAERMRTGQKRNDFLQLLIDVSAEELVDEIADNTTEEIIDNYGDDSGNSTVLKNTSSKYISKEELVAQCAIFFIAGYHTASVTLSLASYLLALHQDIQDKVFSELKTVLGETNGELTYESLMKMKFLDNVIAETLRIHPPIIFLARTVRVDYKLDNTGIILPKGMDIFVPVYAMHRDPDFFPDPERFDPDRFSPEQRSKQIPYTYMPFGAGPRNCIGMRFALLELKVCLAHVLSRFRIRKSPETKVPLEFKSHPDEAFFEPSDIVVLMETRAECPLKN